MASSRVECAVAGSLFLLRVDLQRRIQAARRDGCQFTAGDVLEVLGAMLERRKLERAGRTVS